jgi:hypothetical protein
MANLIRQQKIIDSNKRALIKYVVVSDGSQQSNTILVNVSTLAFAMNTNGYIASSDADTKANYTTTIKRVFGQVSSSSGKLKLQWHGDANSEIVTMSNGSFDYDFQSMGDGATIPNPEANSSGDVLISTTGLSSGDLVTLFIDMKKDGQDYDQGQTADPYAFNRRPL